MEDDVADSMQDKEGCQRQQNEDEFYFWRNSINTPAAWRLQKNTEKTAVPGFLWHHYPAMGFAFEN